MFVGLTGHSGVSVRTETSKKAAGWLAAFLLVC